MPKYLRDPATPTRLPLSRRRFLQATALGAFAASAPRIVLAQAEKTRRVALIGSGWWGMNILRTALQAGGSRAVALCDVDERQLGPAAEQVEKLTGYRPRRYTDFRDLLEKEKPDIVIVATPDHWHPLITIAAVRGGAHVYVEKPIGHTINEGKAMVRAARDTGKVVQVGMHRRVSPHNMSGMAFLKSGAVGEVGMVRAFVHYPGGRGRPTPDAEPPRGLDWNMWCGPAPLRAFNPAMHPKGFRLFLDYANGQLGDWGVHWMDQILWWSEEKWPRKIYSTGSRRIRTDSADAPDTQVATFEFESFTATWEHRQYGGNEAEKANIGCYFYGTRGTFHMGWEDGWTFYPSDKSKPTIHEDARLNQPDGQNIRELWDDFLSCIESRKRPVCDIEIGHRSTNMSLLAMLSLKLGRSIAWDGDKQLITGDPAANALLRRDYRGPWQYPT